MDMQLDVKQLPTSTLQTIHELIRNCLRSDDEVTHGSVAYGVRKHPGWRRLADRVEDELVMRDAFVAHIEWKESAE
jgi:hypothetical protein